MRSALSDAVVRCQVRRLRRAAAAAPVPSALALVIVLLAPVALLRAGRSVGVEIAGAVEDDGVTEAIVLGPAVGAAVLGAAVAASLPGRAALGAQIAVGPFGRLAPLIASLSLPFLIITLVGLPSLLALCVGVAAGISAGATAGLALTAAVAAAVPAGALAAEGGIAAARRNIARPALVLALAVAWVATGVVLGAPALGPLGLVASALRGEEPAAPALVVASVTGAALAALWLLMAAARPERRSARGRSTRPVVRGRTWAVAAALAALLWRRSDVRIAAAGALCFGAGGVVLAAVASAPAPVAFFLGTTTALLGTVFAPLVVCGVLLAGRWLWRSASSEHRAVARAAVVVATGATLIPVALVGLAAAFVERPSWHPIGSIAALVAVGSSVALVAGALMPWTGAALGDQLLTFAAFAVVAVATSFAVGFAAPRLVASGVPSPVLATCLSVLALGTAALVVGGRLGRSRP